MSRTCVLALSLVAALAGPSAAQPGGGLKEPPRPTSVQSVAPATVQAFPPMAMAPIGVAPQAIAPSGGSVIIIVVPGQSGGAAQPFFQPAQSLSFAQPAASAGSASARGTDADALRNEIRTLVETQRRLLQVLEDQERRLRVLEDRVAPAPQPRIPAPSDMK